MKKIDHKMAVLKAVQSQQKPISLAELLEVLQQQFPERSVRRWLDELAKEGSIQKIGQKKGMRYQALSTSPTLFVDSPAIAYIKQPIYLREPQTYHGEWLQSYIPNETFYLPEAQRQLLRQQGERNYSHDMAGTYARHIYNRLLIDLSYNSSRLEGNTYSLLETEKLIIEGNKPAGKLNEEAVMILNHKEAIRYLIENISKIQIDPSVVYTLHYLLADALLPTDECGRVRTHEVKIGGSTYIPLSNKVKLETNLAVICRKAALIQDPYEQSFFLLAHIAYLQSFQDCNKRTSRLSANISLIRENLVPLSFNDVPKEDYITAMLAIYELNNVQPLIDLYLYSYTRTCKQYNTSVESLGFDRIRVQYRQQRREFIREIITKKLIARSMLEYIDQQTAQSIPAVDLAQFRLTLLNDIDALSVSHIRGMGIDPEAFYAWGKLKASK